MFACRAQLFGGSRRIDPATVSMVAWTLTRIARCDIQLATSGLREHLDPSDHRLSLDADCLLSPVAHAVKEEDIAWRRGSKCGHNITSLGALGRGEK